jgi:HK97 family phage major capsid protein
MSLYLDRLNEEFESVMTGVDETLNRAATEGRELSEDEGKTVARSQERAEELRRSIEHFGTIEETRAKVSAVRAKVPATQPQNVQTVDRAGEYKLEDDFPTVGHYISTLHRAMVDRDKTAIEVIDRATAHQKTTDNPGIIPRPVLAPVINLIDASRPFVNSISRKALPAGSFDRPRVTQHVAVGVQAAEKDLTASQKLLIDKLPVSARTFAGHLNISRQDIKWSQPGILQIVAEDFAAVYAQETDADAATQFLASITAADLTLDTLAPAEVVEALFAGATNALTAGSTATMADTLWVSPDVWGRLGSIVTQNGGLLFPSLTPGSVAGANTLGLRVVVDPHFAAGTAVMGPAKYLEFYEDTDGLITVQEPDVLGQLVGYAGYTAFLNTAPAAFTALTLPALGA